MYIITSLDQAEHLEENEDEQKNPEKACAKCVVHMSPPWKQYTTFSLASKPEGRDMSPDPTVLSSTCSNTSGT